MSYDNWLEGPYQEAAAHDEAYQRFCESHNLDPESSEAEGQWDDYLTEEPDPDVDRDYDRFLEESVPW